MIKSVNISETISFTSSSLDAFLSLHGNMISINIQYLSYVNCHPTYNYTAFIKFIYYLQDYRERERVIVFHATFNNISAISWRSVLLVEETWVHRENHQPVTSHWQTLSHNVVSNTPSLSWIGTNNISGDRHWLHR